MELWDIYDERGERTGRTARRETWWTEEPPAPGDYHLAVCAVIVNRRKEILCTHRAPEKASAPGMWENSGGSVLAGESSGEAILRELREETGLSLAPDEPRFFYRSRKADFYMDVYLVLREADPAALTLQPGETDAARWFSYEEWEALARSGAILCPSARDDENFFATLRELLRRM